MQCLSITPIWQEFCTGTCVRTKKRNILLVGNDDTYRRMLLESHGYSVTPVEAHEALSTLERETFHFVLVASESGVANAAEFCGKLKLSYPKMRIGVVAQHGEHVPLEACADVVIRAQYSPAAFLGAVNTVLKEEEQEEEG